MYKAISIALLTLQANQVNQQLEMVFGNSVPNTLPEINDFYVSFLKRIATCANTVTPRFKFNPHSKPSWTKKVKEVNALGKVNKRPMGKRGKAPWNALSVVF